MSCRVVPDTLIWAAIIITTLLLTGDTYLFVFCLLHYSMLLWLIELTDTTSNFLFLLIWRLSTYTTESLEVGRCQSRSGTYQCHRRSRCSLHQALSSQLDPLSMFYFWIIRTNQLVVTPVIVLCSPGQEAWNTVLRRKIPLRNHSWSCWEPKVDIHHNWSIKLAPHRAWEGPNADFDKLRTTILFWHALVLR